MSILFSAKLFSDVINDFSFTRYSAPELNPLLGTAEKFFLEAKASAVPATATNLLVTLETSNDNVNWSVRTTAINAVIVSGTVLFASDFAGGNPVGRFARYGCKLSAAQATGAYVELWVTGRDAR
jgi:hypothetical protein